MLALLEALTAATLDGDALAAGELVQGLAAARAILLCDARGLETGVTKPADGPSVDVTVTAVVAVAAATRSGRRNGGRTAFACETKVKVQIDI